MPPKKDHVVPFCATKGKNLEKSIQFWYINGNYKLQITNYKLVCRPAPSVILSDRKKSQIFQRESKDLRTNFQQSTRKYTARLIPFVKFVICNS